MRDERVRIRVLFADSGAFHQEELEVPASAVRGHDRLIDGLQEDPEVLKSVYLDLDRLCGAWLIRGED